jgi:hypothetical protein
MNKERGLPIPFLILMLAGVMSVISLFVGRGARAGMDRGHSFQVQTIEQERTAAFYFRVLSWLSDRTLGPTERVKAQPHLALAPQITRSRELRTGPDKIELCALRCTRRFATKARTQY